MHIGVKAASHFHHSAMPNRPKAAKESSSGYLPSQRSLGKPRVTSIPRRKFHLNSSLHRRGATGWVLFIFHRMQLSENTWRELSKPSKTAFRSRNMYSLRSPFFLSNTMDVH